MNADIIRYYECKIWMLSDADIVATSKNYDTEKNWLTEKNK